MDVRDWEFYWVTDGLSPHKRAYYVAGDYHMYQNIGTAGFSVYEGELYIGQAADIDEATKVANGDFGS